VTLFFSDYFSRGEFLSRMLLDEHVSNTCDIAAPQENHSALVVL
jgi:hypothetical protein